MAASFKELKDPKCGVDKLVVNSKKSAIDHVVPVDSDT